MYIIANGATRREVRVLCSKLEVRFQGESLTGVTALSGAIELYADNGFHMRTFHTEDEIIRCSALYPEWTAGKHTVGETFLVDGEPWTCFQAYDNAVYPDIAPGQNAWYTFNKPYHGTSRETARRFVHPTGAHDMYKAGEWAVQGGKFTKCVQDTSYSLDEYAAAWKVEV